MPLAAHGAARDISVKAEQEGTFDGFWETLAFVMNAAVFAYSGAATLNCFIRCGASLGDARVCQPANELGICAEPSLRRL